jgi:hypothetical protein
MSLSVTDDGGNEHDGNEQALLQETDAHVRQPGTFIHIFHYLVRWRKGTKK